MSTKGNKKPLKKKKSCVLYAYMCLELQVINGATSSLTNS